MLASYLQCVVARLPSSSPIAARTNKPEQIETQARAARVRRGQPPQQALRRLLLHMPAADHDGAGGAQHAHTVPSSTRRPLVARSRHRGSIQQSISTLRADRKQSTARREIHKFFVSRNPKAKQLAIESKMLRKTPQMGLGKQVQFASWGVALVASLSGLGYSERAENDPRLISRTPRPFGTPVRN